MWSEWSVHLIEGKQGRESKFDSRIQFGERSQIEEFGFLLEKRNISYELSKNDRGRTSKNSLLQKSNEKTGGKNGQNQLFRTLGINQTLAAI